MKRRLHHSKTPKQSHGVRSRLLWLALALPSTSFASDVADFRSSTLPTGWTLGGAASLTAGNVDAEGDGWLRLTDTSNDSVGYAVSDTAVDTSTGILIAFEFASWGGSGADGFSAFLYDGSLTSSSFTIGSTGGFLGYYGASQVYVGVGVDEYGNFSDTSAHFSTGPGFWPDSVVVRGAYDDDYTYIDGVYVSSLDYPYTSTRPSGSQSKKLFVLFETASGGGMEITGYMRTGDGTVVSQVLGPVTYSHPAPASLKLGLAGSTRGVTNNHDVRNLALQDLDGRDPADIVVVGSVSPSVVLPGDTVTYTITVNNLWATTASGMDLSSVMPTGITSNSWSCVPSSGSTCTASGTGDLVDSGVSIPSGGSVTYTVVTTADNAATGDLIARFTANLSANDIDGDPSDNTTALTVRISDDADSDGIDNEDDSDDDNDGIPDGAEPDVVDSDGDGLVNTRDLDSDGDGVSDLYEAGYSAYDTDGDGRIDGGVETNGIPSAIADGAGTIDCVSPDSLLTNASFEDPYVNGFGFVADGVIPGWHTTDSTGYIELWGESMGVSMLDGVQFAELNAYYSAELYQYVATTPGETYTLVVGHRGRAGVDVARFLVDGVETDVYTDDTTAWGVYISTFTATNSTTRIGFESVSTATGDASVGNFFDVVGVYVDCSFPDSDADGIDDFLDTDDDGDSLLTIDEDANADGDPRNDDSDGDGTPDYLDLDSDGDLLSDEEEVANYGTDPTSTDTDGDGLGDYDEVTGGTTSPTIADTDGDGLSDGDELNTHNTDPTVSDSDGDGLSDGDEVNSYGSDPLNTDSDSDLLTDGEEANTIGTDPILADTDGDGLGDGSEVYGYGTNPLNADTDGDGLGDGDELNLYGSLPLDADSDDDGLADGAEAYTYLTNPTDRDSDGDTLTDGQEAGLSNPGTDTDPTLFIADSDPNTTTDPALGDTDGDGLNDGDEDSNHDGAVSLLETDPNDADTDDGGVDDGTEEGRGSDPLDPADDYPPADTDGDGLTDDQELDQGTNAYDQDSDEDGLTDYEEFIAGDTDPTEFDTDGDGLGDGQEQGRITAGPDTDVGVFRADSDPSTTTDPGNADSDGDGLLDGAEDSNQDGAVDGETDPNNADTDGGSIDDGTEVARGSDPLDPADDLDQDQDGLSDEEEADVGTSPTNPDSDGDGLTDGQEVNETSTNPIAPDTDGDGLSDGEEVNSHGTDPNLSDTDGGGVIDGVEVNDQGTDPLDGSDDKLDVDTGKGDYNGGCGCASTPGDGQMALGIGVAAAALLRRRRR